MKRIEYLLFYCNLFKALRLLEHVGKRSKHRKVTKTQKMMKDYLFEKHRTLLFD